MRIRFIYSPQQRVLFLLQGQVQGRGEVFPKGASETIPMVPEI